MKVVADRYRIDGVLGRGGFSTVYRATDLRGAVPVALKILRETPDFPVPIDRRLAREALSMADLRHPNLVGALDHGRDGGVRYLAVELVEGELLRARLDRGPLPCHEAIDLTRQLLAGLAHAHGLGIVHRDVKPTNILLTPRPGGGSTLKLVDFGFARRVGDLGEDLALAAGGRALGTPGYLAPERLNGLPDGMASDVYAVGVVLFEMLAGRAPFAGSADERMLAHLQAPVPSIGAAVPRAIEAIVRRALEKDPRVRYRDATEMGLAIERAAPHHAPPVIRPLRVARRRRAWIAAAAAALFLTLATATVGAWTSGEAPDEKTASARDR